MHVNSAERSIITKLCYAGPPDAGKGELLTHLYRHFAAAQGEHTAFEERRFPSRDVLSETMDADEVDSFVTGAEEAMGAEYEELVDAGELVWFRTRLAEATSDDQFAVHVDAFTVAGEAETTLFWDLAYKGADCVVFVADAARRLATMEAWEALADRWSGPVVLLVVGEDDSDEVADWLEFDGEAFAEPGGFDHAKAAFEAAAKMALRHARNSN